MCDRCPTEGKLDILLLFSAGLPRTGQRPLPARRYTLRADLHPARWPSRVAALPPTKCLGSAQQSQRSAPLYEVREWELRFIFLLYLFFVPFIEIVCQLFLSLPKWNMYKLYIETAEISNWTQSPQFFSSWSVPRIILFKKETTTFYPCVYSHQLKC